MSGPTDPDDPAFWMLSSGFTSTPVPGVHNPNCYICTDPEFAQAGLPLCRACPTCTERGEGPGHVPADDCFCTFCQSTDEGATRAVE